MKADARITLAILWMITSCGAAEAPDQLSYETKLKRAETALQSGKVFEAERWAEEALKMKPERVEAQKVMAKVLDRELVEEKSHGQSTAVEELKDDEKTLRVKTLLERSRSLLEMNLLKEANDTAEEALQLDPDNLEASTLLDTVKGKAQKLGREESLFLQNLYEEETNSRVERYLQQIEEQVTAKRWGAARMTVEKILFLDPANAKAKKLLARIEKEDTNPPKLTSLQQDAEEL